MHKIFKTPGNDQDDDESDKHWLMILVLNFRFLNGTPSKVYLYRIFGIHFQSDDENIEPARDPTKVISSKEEEHSEDDVSNYHFEENQTWDYRYSEVSKDLFFKKNQ